MKLRGELAFDHDLVAADVDDVEHLLVLSGADLDAGSAGGAGPGGFGSEGEFEERVGTGVIPFRMERSRRRRGFAGRRDR